MGQSTGDSNRTCGLLRPTLRVGARRQTQLPTVATPGQVMRRTERLLSLRKLGEEDSNLYHLIQSQVAYR